jgi:hypothetical protein
MKQFHDMEKNMDRIINQALKNLNPFKDDDDHYHYIE